MAPPAKRQLIAPEANTFTSEVIAGSMGPCMQALPNDRMRRFVWAMLDTGGQNFAQAAAMAGYPSENKNALASTGSRLAHSANIQAAINEEAIKRLWAGQIVAVSTIVEIAGDPRAKHSDRLMACKLITDRSPGLAAKSEHTVKVVNENKDKIREIQEMCQKFGIDPAGLLGKHGIVIDVTPPPVIDGTEGLEDLL